MNRTWIFDDGSQKHSYDTFPFAFRYMFNVMKKGVEQGKLYSEMFRTFRILSPTGTVYDYDRACDLAKDQGLLTADGMINSREFKRR
jgi:hypothetical protein